MTKLYTYSYNNGTTSYNAKTEETHYKYAILHYEFNVPATAEIHLWDTDGSIAQKYNADDNDVYIGVAKIELEHPTGTVTFAGRIQSAKPDLSKHELVLYCEDYLVQLDDESTSYDTREIVDGVSARYSELKSEIDGDYLTERYPSYTTGTDYYIFDDDMNWTEDQWNGYYVILPIDDIGPITISTGPYDATIDDEAGGSASETNDYTDTWDADGTCYATSQDADKYWDWNFFFRSEAVQGSLYSSITGARVIIVGSLENSGVSTNTGKETADVHVYVTGGLGNPIVGNISSQDATVSLNRYSFEILEPYLSQLVTFMQANEYAKVTIETFGTSDGAGTDFNIDQIALEFDVVIDGYSTAIEITDTLLSGEAIDAVLNYDASATNYNNNTANANTSTADSCPIHQTNPIQTNDEVLFGFSSKVNGFRCKVGTAVGWSGSVAWYHSTGGGSWSGMVNMSPSDAASLEFEYTGYKDYTWDADDQTGWATDTIDGVGPYYWVKLKVAGSSSTTNLGNFTQIWKISGNGNKLKVDTDCSYAGLGLWEGCRYYIAREIHNHINTIVTAGDPQVTLTTDVESTSGIAAELLENKTRLVALQILAEKDGAVFWLPAGTTQMKYKATTDSSSTAITDASVSSWIVSGYDIKKMFNKYTVRGVRKGDVQIEETYSDATSIAKYNCTRNKTYNSEALTSHDALALATALVNRDKDVHFDLAFEIKGIASALPAYRLGDYLEVTSSLLNITEVDYTVVSMDVYLNPTNKVVYHLQPSSTYGYTAVTDTPIKAIRTLYMGAAKEAGTKYNPYPPESTS